ncbi:MAG TPA: PilZ domain-containing protein [Devosiaceae bacterium]|jgi:alginate biosynthesis protein Alg44
MNENFVKFEADVQRQHARYQLPLRCTIGNQTFKVLDWSVAGIGISAPGANLPEDSIQDIKLEFPFVGSSFSLDMKARVRYSRPVDGRTGLQYVEVTPEQMRLMRYVLDGHLSGELVAMDDVLDIQKRPVEARARRDGSAAKAGGVSALGTLVRLALVAIVTVGLLWFIASSIYQRVAVINPASAAIASDATPVYASADGMVTYIAKGSVATGQPAATILVNGQSVTIPASCDCVVEDAVAENTPVKANSRLLSLRSPDTKTFAVAMVDRAQLLDVYQGVTADVQLADGRTITGAPLLDLPSVSTGDSAAQVPVRIDLGAAATGVTVGQPANVKFFRTHPFNNSPLQSVASLFGSAPAAH